MTALTPISADVVIRMQSDALKALIGEVETAMTEGAEACQLTLKTESGGEIQLVVEACHE